MRIFSMSLGPLGTNCYLLDDGEQSIMIDPGGDSEVIVSHMEQLALKPIAILLTHAHFDHIGAVDALKDQFHIPVYINEQESDWLADPMKNGSGLFSTKEIRANDPDHFLPIGPFQIGTFSLEIRHTPGHSPGSVSFVFPKEKAVISGDALFQRGIGRTDLPGGNTEQLISSIRNELFTLSDDFTIYPGHGPNTTIGEEKKDNPFF
ncbi:MBL fold metallo-hydrolase [Aquibacillus sp. 3ASR75-11]|uniref:MBL fold metallo-hydrolase n=1 Tax=Terrihalobacillus insolitus TaxID=2950438 RepID=A0A9X3WT32_9BACI|nr:MBL fold metallo-hydrolase [Terrihalobacillus insolitus]MDC3413397.1 MBL fold metallo-hydrolase [Terrihalobacillus insolitus]MDC3424980.1 MBL fold metallo-hydrolase [Terrihalobacillus insolitus]